MACSSIMLSEATAQGLGSAAEISGLGQRGTAHLLRRCSHAAGKETAEQRQCCAGTGLVADSPHT